MLFKLPWSPRNEVGTGEIGKSHRKAKRRRKHKRKGDDAFKNALSNVPDVPIIPEEEISKGTSIGAGGSATVYKGKWRGTSVAWLTYGTSVAVLCLHCSSAGVLDYVRALVKEMSLPWHSCG